MKNKRFSLGCIVILSLLIPYVCQAQGLSRVSLEAASVQNFNLTVGKSVIVRSSEKVKRVSLVAPETVDALVLTPWQIYLAGKAPGITTVTLKFCTDAVSRLTLESPCA